VSQEELLDFYRATDEALGILAARHGIVVLRQPPETLEGPCFSSVTYARDNDADTRLGKTGMDAVHMNATYGALVWKTHLATVLAAARSRPEPSARAPTELVAV
jgi:hypothetical protein